MKILQQCIYFPPEVGGLESHAFYLCRDLVRLGHDVTMVTSQSKPGVPREENMDGVKVVRRWFPSRDPAGLDNAFELTAFHRQILFGNILQRIHHCVSGQEHLFGGHVLA